MIPGHLSVSTFTPVNPLTFIHFDCCLAFFYEHVLQSMCLMAESEEKLKSLLTLDKGERGE